MELLTKVDEVYSPWYKIWLETLVTKLLYTPKWFKSSQELKPGDLVFSGSLNLLLMASGLLVWLTRLSGQRWDNQNGHSQVLHWIES